MLRPYAEFLAVNPAGLTPAIQDGYITKSIAIMEYLMARSRRVAPFKGGD